MALRTITILLVAAIASSGSTCTEQSTKAEVPKDDSQGVDVTLPGVDTSPLTPREKKEWSGYVSEFLAPCSNVPVSISQCVQEKRDCSKCLPAARFVLRGVRDGMSKDQIEKSYRNRFDADKIRNVPVDDSPSRGPAAAPVTIVEFADFECPYCAMMAPKLDTVWEEYKDKVRFVYKFMPLSAHPHGEIAARAGVAAMMQGKFWEMHHQLFAHRDHLEQPDLDTYAREVGLDVARFHADMNSPAANDRLARDKKLADALDVKGTPTIYINGREFDPNGDLPDWLDQELAVNGGKPDTAVAASTTPSATPSPSTSAKGPGK